MYLYRASYNTSSLDIHDIDFDQTGLWGVNTLFSCLCKFTLAYNFSPRWKPYFITEITPEDRCHLNGLALENGTPKYVSALSSTDSKGGWRKDIMNTGIIMDVEKNEILLMLDGIINGFILGIAFFKWNLRINFQSVRITTREFVYFLESGHSKKVAVKENSKNAGFIIFDLRTRTPFGELKKNKRKKNLYYNFKSKWGFWRKNEKENDFFTS